MRPWKCLLRGVIGKKDETTHSRRIAIEEEIPPGIFPGNRYAPAPYEAPILTEIEATRNIGTPEKETGENPSEAEDFALLPTAPPFFSDGNVLGVTYAERLAGRLKVVLNRLIPYPRRVFAEGCVFTFARGLIQSAIPLSAHRIQKR